MKHSHVWIKTLAVVGTILVAIPLVAPLVLTRWAALGSGHFNFDWLMPAELFPLALLGGVVLLAVALREHSRRALIGWGLGVAVVSLAVGQGFAQVSGLANGAIEPVGPPLWFVIATLALYTAAVAEMVVAGILLSRDLLAHRDEPAPPAVAAM